jgi:hypothetical protein
VSDLLTDARREGEHFRNLPPVGGERMSECIRPHLRDCPTCAYNGRCDAQDATSLERKPLDGYDWRDALHDLGTLKVDANDAVLLRECIAAITAHIESLEAERDWLARWCALYATAPGKSATGRRMTRYKPPSRG